MAIAQTHGGNLFARALRLLTRKPTTVTVTAVDTAEVEALLTEYHQLKAETDPVVRRIGQLKERLADVPDGRYGIMRLRRGKPHQRFDQTAGRARLAALGEPVPMQDVRGAMKVERAA